MKHMGLIINNNNNNNNNNNIYNNNNNNNTKYLSDSIAALSMSSKCNKTYLVFYYNSKSPQTTQPPSFWLAQVAMCNIKLDFLYTCVTNINHGVITPLSFAILSLWVWPTNYYSLSTDKQINYYAIHLNASNFYSVP